MLASDDALVLCAMLARNNVRYWLIGGWGVDALLGRETRTHKDLDILILLEDLPKLHNVLGSGDFREKLIWEESCWLGDEGTRSPSAFVSVDGHGRELDVHVIGLGADGGISQYYDNPWAFPPSVFAAGIIAGTAVPCVSVETQLAMHAGYEIPDAQQRDLKLLRALAARTDHVTSTDAE